MLKRLVFAIALISVGSPVLIADDEPEGPGKPMTKESLRQLYSGKTWYWSDGRAYFRPDGRFFAYSGKSEPTNYIEGGWSAYRNGKICFSGNWHSPSGSGFESTCFTHVSDGGIVHQRKDPFRSWYVFKNAKPQKSDEYRKLVRGDYASPKLRVAKDKVSKVGKG